MNRARWKKNPCEAAFVDAATGRPRPVQFSVRGLLGLTAVVCVGCAVTWRTDGLERMAGRGHQFWCCWAFPA